MQLRRLDLLTLFNTPNHKNAIDPDGRKLLLQLLVTNAENNFFIQDSVYKITSISSGSLSNPTLVSLSHNLILTAQDGLIKKYHFFKFEDFLGAGNYSLVFKEAGQFRVRNQEMYDFKEFKYIFKLSHSEVTDSNLMKLTLFNNLKTDKNFKDDFQKQLCKLNLDKEFSIKENVVIEKLAQECQITRLIEKRVKSPFYVCLDDIIYTFTAIGYYPGKELFKILEDDFTRVNSLSIKCRLSLTQSLLHAYVNQLYLNNIVHRDLKPENILVALDFLNEEVLSCHIIDFNLSKRANEINEDLCGSMDYLPPEAFAEPNATMQGDMHALGKIISLIWHNNFEMAVEGNILQAAQKAKEFNVNNMFVGIEGLAEKYKIILTDILYGMTRQQVEQRTSPLLALQRAEQMYLDYLATIAKEKNHKCKLIEENPNRLFTSKKLKQQDVADTPPGPKQKCKSS